MNRVDFHTISAILFQHLKEADTSQIDYVYMIFASFSNDTEDFMYDNGLVCKWIKGQAKVSPRIVNYYVDDSHKEAMYQDIEKELFPYLSDYANAANDIKTLLISDTSLSDFKKERLLALEKVNLLSNILSFTEKAIPTSCSLIIQVVSMR